MAPGVSPRVAVPVAAAADALGVSAWLVRQMVAAGELPSVRIRRRVLIPVKALEEWVAAHTEVAS